MNTKLIALGVVVVLGLWWLFGSTITPTPTTPTTDNMATTTATTTPQTPTKTQPEKPKPTPITSSVPATRKPLLPFLSNSQSTKCTYETVSGSSRTSSILYMSKGVLRGEFRTWSGDTASSDMVHYDGAYVYTWKEGMSSGTKRIVSTLSDLPALIPRDLTSGSVLGTATNNASWDCHQWIVEKAKMTLPSYVSFK